MKNIHRTTNQGLQRLVESYSPRISEYDVLDFLKKKGFDPSSQLTKNYASGVAEYLSYPENDDYDLNSWYKDTLMNYPEDFEELPKLNEALSPEAKANNEMIDSILAAGNRKLNKQQIDFLDKNGLKVVTINGRRAIETDSSPWVDPELRKHPLEGAPYKRAINKKTSSNIDKLDYLNKETRGKEKFLNKRASQDILDKAKQRRGEFQLARYRGDKGNWDASKEADAIYAFSNPTFAESLEDSDYQDFLHSLSEVVTKESKKWKDRGISISDVYNALEDLSVRYEDLSDEDLDEALDFKTMPIPKEGSTFAFRATVDESEVSRLLQKKGFKVDKINDNGTLVWLIGHGDTDHIATYVPSTKTLYTSTRELFREAFSPKKR